MSGMTSHARKGWTVPQVILAALVTVISAALAPLFFADLFTTVVHLLAGPFGWWAWTVPVGTEASFVVLYLLDLLLELRGKPMGWLRWAPYPFAAASLWLNVTAAHGDRPAMVGHAVVTVAFFTPLLAAKAAVRSLSASEEDIALAAEAADARRYALDLLRDRKGRLWRWRVPSLLRTQVLRARPPAAVAEAVADGARYGGAAKWESAVEKWVADGLTQGVKMAVTVRRRERVIEASVRAPDEARAVIPPPRHPKARKAVSARAAKAAKVRELLSDGTARTRPEIAGLAGVSVATVDRIKRDMPTPIRSRQAAGN